MSIQLFQLAITGLESTRPLAVSVSPSSINQAVGTPCPLTSVLVTANPSSGDAPYAYQWTRESGTGISADSPTSRSTTFTKNNAGASTTIFRCTVTDSLFRVAAAEVSVILECGGL